MKQQSGYKAAAARCRMVFGAVLLLVLFAGLDRPATQLLSALPVSVASSVERIAIARHPAIVVLPQVAAGERPCRAEPPVRPTPRWRSIAARGLPAPRAPTA
jgi:hypothetical protein